MLSFTNFIKEDMTASSGDVRGMGYVTGDPNGGFQSSWTTLNQADADTRDQIMNQTKRDVHDSLHPNLPTPKQDDIKKNAFVRSVINALKGKNR